jgi:hypothetical protein
MESIVLIDSNVPDNDFLMRAVDRGRCHPIVMSAETGVKDLLSLNIADRLASDRLTSIAWVFSGPERLHDIFKGYDVVRFLEEVTAASPRCTVLHLINVSLETDSGLIFNPYQFLDRCGVRVTLSRNMYGAAHHLIRSAQIFERCRYFTDLIYYYPLVQVDTDTSRTIMGGFNLLDTRCAIKDSPYLKTMQHDLLNHHAIVSKIICTILMKFKELTKVRYDRELVHNLDAVFAALFAYLTSAKALDPVMKATLRRTSQANFDEKIYVIVALLVVNYGIDPAAIVSFCERYGISTADVFLGYIRSGQVVFFAGRDCRDKAIHDICTPLLSMEVNNSYVNDARSVMLGPRTKLVIFSDLDFEGKDVIFENDSFTDNKVVNVAKWRFEFRSYKLAQLEQDFREEKPPAFAPTKKKYSYAPEPARSVRRVGHPDAC